MNGTEVPSFYKDLGNMIRQRRKAIGETQERLAARIGMSRATVANIETGRQQILVHQLYQLASALQLPVKQLLPPMPTSSPTEEPTDDMLLPNNLSRQQRLQISRVLSGALKRSVQNNEGEGGK